MRTLWSLLLSRAQPSPKSSHCTAWGAVSLSLHHTVTLLFLAILCDGIALCFSPEDDELEVNEVINQYYSP